MSDAAAFLIALGRQLSVMSLYGPGHRAREESLDKLTAELSTLLRGNAFPAFSFLDGDVVYEGHVMGELRHWEWSIKLAEVGIERLEVSPSTTREALEGFLEEAHGRMSLEGEGASFREMDGQTAIQFGGVTLDPEEAAADEEPLREMLALSLDDEAEVIQYFNADPHTEVIALYLEGVKRPSYFLDALREGDKPLVILKAGRTKRGGRAAESHTKSLAGVDAIYQALFRKHRVYRADTLEELFDFAKALAYLTPPQGRNLMITTSSGGAAILAIDEAEKQGLSTPEPAPALKERLQGMIPAHCVVSNPVDLTGDVIGDPSLYRQVMDATQSEYDYQVVIFGDPIPGASQVVTPGAAELVVFLGGAEVEQAERHKLYEAGVPVFPTPERGIAALAQFFRFAPQRRPDGAGPVLPSTPGLRLLPGQEAAEMLANAGIPVAAAPLAKTPDEAVALARQFGYPVVLKVASPDIPHKSDVGGVHLNLTHDEAVRQAFQDILETSRHHDRKVRVDGVTVSPMAKLGGLEVILGTITDHQYGPTLMFGLGGIYTEIYQDVAFLILPATEAEMEELIRSIRGYPLLTGFRGQPPRDLAALKGAMEALAIFAQRHPELDQIELNPLLLYEKGLFVVDARIFSRI